MHTGDVKTATSGSDERHREMLKLTAQMTKEEATQFRERWNLVNQARFEEVRQMSPAKKLKQLETLFEFGETVGWSVPSGEEGWEYWRRLKELSNV